MIQSRWPKVVFLLLNISLLLTECLRKKRKRFHIICFISKNKNKSTNSYNHVYVFILFQEVVDLVDTDSSVEEQEDGEDFEDAPETFQVDDDIFIDHVQPTKIQHLSKLYIKTNGFIRNFFKITLILSVI